MRKLLLGLALLATMATGCKKEKTITPVNNNVGGGSNTTKTGDVLLVNNSENAYVITIYGDGFVPRITIAGKSSQTTTLAVGEYPFVATEKEGYTGSPTVIKETVKVKSGSTTIFTIP